MNTPAKWKNYSKESLFEMAENSFNKRDFFIKMGYKKYCGTTMKNILEVYPELNEILPNKKNTLLSKWKNFTKEEIYYFAKNSNSIISFMRQMGYTSCRPDVFNEIVLMYPEIKELIQDAIPISFWKKYSKEQLQNFSLISQSQSDFCKKIGYESYNSYAIKQIQETYPSIKIPKEDVECKWKKFTEEQLQSIADISNGLNDFYNRLGYTINTGRGDVKRAIKEQYPNFIFPPSIPSKGELKIKEVLLSLNIQFKEQFTFNDLRGKNKQFLKFDFAIFKMNELKCLIEFQGEQHYKDIPHFKEPLETRIMRDNKKREYCLNKKIPLIEIKYTDYEKIDDNYIKERLYEYYYK